MTITEKTVEERLCEAEFNIGKLEDEIKSLKIGVASLFIVAWTIIWFL